MPFPRDAATWRLHRRAHGTNPNPTTPTIISGPSVVDPIGETSATITWTVDRNVTGQIEYGLTAGYGSSTTAETSLSFSQHSQSITGLTANTLYHYHVIGQDASAQSYDSGDLTFTTASTAASTDYPTTANPMVFQSLISASEPAYLGVHTCSSHQGGTTEIIRVSNAAGVANNYSSMAAFNSDETMLMLTRISTARIIRTSDWTILNSSPSGLGIGWFSNTNPNLAFSLTGTRTLREVSVSAAGATTTITEHTPTRPGGGSYTSVNFGGGQGQGSDDDRYFAFFWTTSTQYGIATYDRTTRTTIAEKVIGSGAQRIDNCGMSHSGLYCQYNITDDGSGSGTTIDKGMWIVNRSLTSTFQAATKQEHWDWGVFENGQDAFCYWQGDGIRAVNAVTQVKTNLGNSFSGNTHLSGRNINRPGWIYVSRAGVGGTSPGSNQFFALKLDGSGDTQCFGWLHRTQAPSYLSDTMGCASPTGKYVTWGGYWEGGSTIHGYVAAVDVIA